MPDTPAAWLASLPADRLGRLASTFADLAFAEGLAVTDVDTGERRPIPPSLTPVVVEDRELARRVEAARTLTSAVAKVARAILDGPEREVLLAGLAPFERRAVEATFRDVGIVATTRYDAFVAQGRMRPLELNATIPAMQGYSDIAASAFLRAVAAERGVARQRITGLIGRNGSNVAALLKAIVACYRARGGRTEAPAIALACRPNDAQITELRYLARSFDSLGYRARVVLASEVRPERGGPLWAEGTPFDLVYRHIFARRIEDGWPIAQALFDPAHYHVYNPVLPQLEEKAAFAELSRAAHDPALADRFGLTDDEVALAQGALPWTRRALDGPARGPRGESVDRLKELVRSDPKRFVLKPSWDYGGKAVFVGASLDEARVQAAFGRPMSWSEIADVAFGSGVPGGYVVQEFVDAQPERHLLCEPSGPAWRELYVDFSAYASLGIDPPGWGGVCRVSTNRIVNILGGGGVAPLLRAEVVRELFA